MAEIRLAEFPTDEGAVRDLLVEYAASLAEDAQVCITSMEREIAGLTLDGGMYGGTGGRFLLAVEGDAVAGGVGLRELGGTGHERTAELRRLYIRPAYRGRQLGRWLAMAALWEASRAGYRCVRLETAPSMTEAQHLYESMGFRDVSANGETPPGMRTMELELPPIEA